MTIDEFYHEMRLVQLGAKTCYAKIINGVIYYKIIWRI